MRRSCAQAVPQIASSGNSPAALAAPRLGMTIDEVKAVWGEPTEAVQEEPVEGGPHRNLVVRYRPIVAIRSPTPCGGHQALGRRCAWQGFVTRQPNGGVHRTGSASSAPNSSTQFGQTKGKAQED